MTTTRHRVGWVVLAASTAAALAGVPAAAMSAGDPVPAPAPGPLPATAPAPATASAPGTHGQVTYWSPYHPHCAGTLIMPRVMLTAGECLRRRSRDRYFLRIDGVPTAARSMRNRARVGPIGDLGVVLLDRPYVGRSAGGMAAIPSYRQEQIALTDGNAALTEGTRLVAYTNDAVQRRPVGAPRRWSGYLRKGGRPGDEAQPVRPLVYRSVAGYRGFEPQRLNGRSPNQLFSPTLMRLFYSSRNRRSSRTPFGVGDAALNDALILTAGIDADRHEQIVSPIPPAQRGGGVFYLDAGGREWLAGSVMGAHMQVRHSELWPWVFGILVKHGMLGEARQLARAVLGTGSWGDYDRQGAIGDIYLYDNPYTREIEFFRLIGLDRHGRYGYFPNSRKHTEHWQYLGTELPEAREVTTPIHAWQEGRNDGKAGDIFVRMHPVRGAVEFFRLKQTGAEGKAPQLPPDAAGNEHWEYLGTDIVV